MLLDCLARLARGEDRHAADLIRARSPDPPGDEAEICAVLADRLRGLGFAPEVEEFAPRRFNLLVRLKGAGARPAS